MRILHRAVIALILLAIVGCQSYPPLGDGVTQPQFTFGVIADVQYADVEPAGSRYYRASADRLAQCIDDFNSRDLSFVVQVGDLIDRDEASFDPLLEHFERLNAPVKHVLGNHDFSVSAPLKPTVPQRLGMKQRYYEFKRGPFRFIVVDGNALSLYVHEKNSAAHQQAETKYEELKAAGRQNAYEWNAAVDDKQMRWIDQKLAAADRQGEKAILFCHFPIAPDNAHNLWNDAEMLAMIDRHPSVVAWINGHNHKGNYILRNSVHYLTLHGMVETADTTAYGVIAVYNDRLEVQGIGREPTRILSLSHPQSVSDSGE